MAIDISSIVTGPHIAPPKVVIYGPGGVGKTTWCTGAPNPVFIFTEEGQGGLDVARFQPAGRPVVASWPELIECLSVLHREDHDRETVVVDTLDCAEPLLWQLTAAKHGKADIEDFGYGKGYVYALDEARTMLAWLDALRRDRGMATIIVCHSDHRKFEPPDSESFDRYSLRLQNRLANLIHDWTDALLFATYRMAVVKDDEKGNQQRRRAIGRGERVVYTEARPAWVAKNRYGLPPEIELSWQAFQDGMFTQTQTPTEE